MSSIMIYSIKNLSKQKKQVLILFASTLLSVFLGVIASVINTRFLSTIEYGNVRYVQNILNFISSILVFGYFWSGSRLLALSKDEERSRSIRGVLIILLAVTTLIMCLCLIASYFIHFDSKQNVARLFIVSLPVCFYPLFSTYVNTVSQGDNHIGRIALARTLPILLYIPIAYLMYSLNGATGEKLILLQWGCYSIVLFTIIMSTHPKFQNLGSIFTELRKENHDYGIQLYIGSLVMVASNYLAGITLGMFNQDNSEVGLYTLALTVTSPLSLLPSIIGTTYFKEFATQERIPDRVMKFTMFITIISFLLFVVLIKPVVALLYPEDYAKVGIYAIWLAAGFSIHGFGDMINQYLGSHGQGISIRNSSIANGVLKIFGFTVLVYLFNTPGALMTNILCSTVYCLTLLFYYSRFRKK